MLSAIVCPLTPRELPAALTNLAFWDTAMPPASEGEEAGKTRPKLIFSFNGAPDENLSRPLLDEFDKRAVVKGSFEAVEVRFCNLPPEKDLYLREGEVGYAPFGRKSGPNWMFFETLRALRDEAKFVFLMETDCQPLRPNWLGRIRRVCLLNDDAWVIGSHYCGASPLHWSVARHINGNALYHVGDPPFWDFMENFFWPWLNDYIVKNVPDLAYDCGWETYLNRMEMEHAGSYEWIRVRDILQRFRLSTFVVNIAGAAEQDGDYLWTRADILKRFPGATILHGPLATSNDHRRGPLGFGRVFLEGSAELNAGTLHADHDLESVTFRRSMWITGQLLDETCEVAVSFLLDCPEDASLTVAWRDPSGRLEGSTKIFGAGIGAPKLGGYVQAITTPAPYLRLVLRFDGPEGAQISVSELKCEVKCAGRVLGRLDRMLTF